MTYLQRPRSYCSIFCWLLLSKWNGKSMFWQSMERQEVARYTVHVLYDIIHLLLPLWVFLFSFIEDITALNIFTLSLTTRAAVWLAEDCTRTRAYSRLVRYAPLPLFGLPAAPPRGHCHPLILSKYQWCHSVICYLILDARMHPENNLPPPIWCYPPTGPTPPGVNPLPDPRG